MEMAVIAFQSVFPQCGLYAPKPSRFVTTIICHQSQRTNKMWGGKMYLILHWLSWTQLPFVCMEATFEDRMKIAIFTKFTSKNTVDFMTDERFSI